MKASKIRIAEIQAKRSKTVTDLKEKKIASKNAISAVFALIAEQEILDMKKFIATCDRWLNIYGSK